MLFRKTEMCSEREIVYKCLNVNKFKIKYKIKKTAAVRDMNRELKMFISLRSSNYRKTSKHAIKGAICNLEI